MGDPLPTLLALSLGVGLAAACGLRVFLPLLALGAAARLDLVPLAPGFGWVAGTPALVVLGTATLLEIAAYYIPWLDNALDAIAGPVAVLAGVTVTASVLVEVPPVVRWTVAVIAGGGASAAVQAATSVLRLKSSALTGGLANPLLATSEWVGALALALLALLVPLLGFAVVATAVALLLRRRGRRPA
jgi:hypothetical protein